jgi:four helix bundle protein
MGLQQSLCRNAGNAGAVGGLGNLALDLDHDHDRHMKTYFDQEKLEVYQHAIAFCGWVGDFLSTIAAKTAANDQLDRASTSIPLNIAEANGKFSDADRGRFLEIARGSAFKCAACPDVLVARKLATAHDIVPAKEQLVSIVKMLMGLLKRFSGRAGFLREDEPGYISPTQWQQDQDQDQDQGRKQTQDGVT